MVVTQRRQGEGALSLTHSLAHSNDSDRGKQMKLSVRGVLSAIARPVLA
jgi:hypothetical protein